MMDPMTNIVPEMLPTRYLYSLCRSAIKFVCSHNATVYRPKVVVLESSRYQYDRR